MPRWDSKRDGKPIKLLSEPPHNVGDQPEKAASARQPVGHMFARIIIQKGDP